MKQEIRTIRECCNSLEFIAANHVEFTSDKLTEYLLGIANVLYAIAEKIEGAK